MPDPLRDVLGPGGALSRVLPAYEPRAAQLAMAARVEDALSHGRALIVEAGTGTGKTLAYLLPAARSGLKVVVSTATKTLQEQLAEKDVPLLQALGVDAKVAFLKGRQNYLCLLRFDQFTRNPTFAVREEASIFEAITQWAETTRTGDRAELTEIPDNLASWRDLSASADQCLGAKCAHYDRCFVFRMRREAADADVVVVNHHLFFADLALRSSSAGDSGAAVLPKYDAVVFDEAHAVEEVATEHFGAQLSSFRVAELARDALKALQTRPQMLEAAGLASRLAREGRDFFDVALETAPAAATARKGSGAASGDSSRWPLLPGALAPAEAERGKLVELTRALGAALSASADEELLLLERRCLSLGADLALFAEPALSADLIHWGESRAGHLFLHASPIDVAGLLQEKLYDRIGPVVFTSATLAVAGQLDYFARRLGLADDSGALFPLEAKVLASPFDYQSNAALYLPRQMPDPQDPSFAEAVAEELRALLPITEGRAFVLFTSLRNMRAVHALLAGELPWQVLLQGEAPKAQLLKKFRERPSVLFASQSFWEGVDVPGEALSLVVIDKLPFASPSEPIVAARIERLRAGGQDAFYGYQVPQAALALKQGFGRLIRTATDRGIVAVLDARMTRKNYGRLFVESLPRCRVLRTPGEAAGFWSGGVAPKGATGA
ncbi:MAG TPA: ATP-dependent DNA helicase [Myxococcales bacterium]|nr:ATP-dependent DNA helicase [Myxococcales bacterium]